MKGTLRLNKEPPIDYRMTSIRLATSADVDRMVAYGEKFWRQTRYYSAGVEYDVDTVTHFTRYLLDEGVVMYAVDNDQDRIIALMLVIIAPFPMNMNHLCATEWVFYVDADYRRGGLGIRLIEQAEQILKDRRVKFFTMVSLANVVPESANKLYEALGFEHSETNFTKELSWPS